LGEDCCVGDVMGLKGIMRELVSSILSEEGVTDLSLPPLELPKGCWRGREPSEEEFGVISMKVVRIACDGGMMADGRSLGMIVGLWDIVVNC
jgi:hypothetical protein